MAQRRKRDQVWITALTKTAMGEKAVTLDQILKTCDVGERTARETLTVMADTPFLQKDRKNDGTVRYLAGPAFD